MKTKLFKKLHSVFKGITGNRSQDDLFLYFSLREGEDFASESISRNINNKRPLDKNCLQRIQSNEDWSSGSSPYAKAVRDSQSLLTPLTRLHEEYLPDIDTPESCNDILGNLIRLCFCGDYRKMNPPVPEPCFDSPDYFSTQRSAKGFIKRDDIIEEMRASLEQRGMVILSGGAGIGKTFLVKSFYRKYRKAFTDFCHLEYGYSLDSSIETIRFKGRKNRGKAKWELLSLKSQDSLLFIDNMDCTPAEMANGLARLANLQLKIIIATRTAILPMDAPVIKVGPMDDNQLSELYMNDMPNAGTDCTGQETLFRLLDRNPLAISLAAKMAARMHYSVEELTALLKNSEFGTLKESPKYKHRYSDAELKYLGHVRSIYRQYSGVLADDDRAMLGAFSCFGNAAVPCTLFSTWIQGADDGWMQRMADMGIFLEATPGTVRMHRLVADAVFLTEKPRYKSCKTLISGIHGCILDARYSLKLMDIQDAVHEVASRLSASVKPYNNTGQKAASKEQEAWWGFVLDSITYLLGSGNADCAGHLLKNIYTIKGETQQDHPYYIFKMVLDFHNDWINGCSFNQLVSSLEGLMDYILLNKDFIRKYPLGYGLMSGYLAAIMFDKLDCLSLQSMPFFRHHKSLHNIPPGRKIQRNPRLPTAALDHLYGCLQQSPYLTGEELTHYGFIYEYLHTDAYDPQALYGFANKMYRGFKHYLEPSVRIRYICNLIPIYCTCAAFTMADNQDTASCHKQIDWICQLKERLDWEISQASLLPRTIFNLCATAYYSYAACLMDARAIASAKKMTIECYSKTPNTSWQEEDSSMKAFSKLFESALKSSSPCHVPGHYFP